MKKIITILLSIFVFSSCKIIIEKKYGMNKPFKFKERKEYIEYLNAKGFPSSNVLFVNDSSSYEFYRLLSDSQLGAYFGSLLNDSTEIRKTDELKENLSCAGRIIKDIDLNARRMEFDSSFLVQSNFKTFSFKRLDNNEKFFMNSTNQKLKIIMLYGFSLGTLYDPLYREIINFYEQNKDKTELYIISLDPVGSLP
jgi:hypothetical protein